MISHLKIRNYALIESLEIDFSSGFITITGETGAGKSILMGALSLILGQRADTSVMFSRDEKCIVEGEFRIADTLKDFFAKNELDFEKHTFLRREILPGGKSRAFINDTPVNLTQLKNLGSMLVDIHSQHQNLRLNDQTYQMNVVDYVSGNDSLLSKYIETYQLYRNKLNKIEKLNSEYEKGKGELDFYQFQYDELKKAQLVVGEKEQLEEEMNQLEHAEEIKLALSRSTSLLQGEQMILDLLNEVLQSQKKVSHVNPDSVSFAERIESTYIELKDLADEMTAQAENMDYDPARLEKTKGRIDQLFSLLQKHRCEGVEELINIMTSLEQKIESITFSDENIKKLQEERDTLYLALQDMADDLHNKRLDAAERIEKKVSVLLTDLGIPNATFNIRMEKADHPGPTGMDNVNFLFSANKQAPAEEISSVASGGEISRLMLSIKSLLSDYKGLPTLIFDEIDAGVSGDIADKMGLIMRKMSGGRQVIAITHLPQVAAQGDEHFLVFKTDEEQSTITRLKKLSSDERVVEIAKLLSGEKVTDAALSNARELLRIS
ncbi:MAG TPA: DNA repair protein RecN [Bacteroidales bacterium]|nr:DNA repair protein RecN [Bacteroidales bacterium]